MFTGSGREKPKLRLSACARRCSSSTIPIRLRTAAKIAAIRTAWKQKTGDQSVLQVTEPADVSF